MSNFDSCWAQTRNATYIQHYTCGSSGAGAISRCIWKRLISVCFNKMIVEKQFTRKKIHINQITIKLNARFLTTFFSFCYNKGKGKWTINRIIILFEFFSYWFSSVFFASFERSSTSYWHFEISNTSKMSKKQTKGLNWQIEYDFNNNNDNGIYCSKDITKFERN